MTATRVDAALITWLEGVDPGFTVSRGNSSWILLEDIRPGRLRLDGSGDESAIVHGGIPPGLLRLHGSGDDDDSKKGKRRGRGHDRDEQAVIVHEGIPPGLLRPHPTGGSKTGKNTGRGTGKNTGRGHARDEEAPSNETPPLTDGVDFDDIPGLPDGVELPEGGLETPDSGEDLVDPDGDDPSSTGSSRDDAAALASVPEPSSMLLLVSAAVAWATRSRHRRRQRD